MHLISLCSVLVAACCAVTSAAPGLYSRGVMMDDLSSSPFELFTMDEDMTVEEAHAKYRKAANLPRSALHTIWYTCTNIYGVGVGACTRKYAPNEVYETYDRASIGASLDRMMDRAFGNNTHGMKHSNACMVSNAGEKVLCVNSDVYLDRKIAMPTHTRRTIARFVERTCLKEDMIMASRFSVRVGPHKSDTNRYVTICFTNRAQACGGDIDFCPSEIEVDSRYPDNEYRHCELSKTSSSWDVDPTPGWEEMVDPGWKENIATTNSE